MASFDLGKHPAKYHRDTQKIILEIIIGILLINGGYLVFRFYHNPLAPTAQAPAQYTYTPMPTVSPTNSPEISPSPTPEVINPISNVYTNPF